VHPVATTDEVEDHPKVTWPEVMQLLRRRHFVALLINRIFGQLGDGMVQAALATFVLFSPERQATSGKIAVAFAILLLPYSVFGPFIGIFIDRWPRQQILLWISVLRALSVGLIAFVVVRGDEGVWLGLAVLTSLGIGRFLQATQGASLPHVATGRELVTANAFAPTAGTIASAAGGVLGVVVQKLGGPDYGVLVALGVSALMQIVAGYIAKHLPRDLLGPDSVVLGLREQMSRTAQELGDGARHLTQRQSAWRALAVVSVHRSVFGLVSVMAILLTRHALNSQAAAGHALGEFTIAVGGAAIGAFVGASMTPYMVGVIGTQRWSTLALLWGAAGTSAFMLVTIAFPTHPWAVATLIISGIFLGWCGQSIKVCADAIVQASVEDDYRGRVFAIYDMTNNVGLVSGIVLAAGFISPDGVSVWAIGFIAIALALAPLLLRRPPVA